MLNLRDLKGSSPTFLASKIFEFLKLLKAVKNRELLRIAIYVTERCNSRCKTCLMWRKRNPRDMPLEVFYSILDDVDRKTHLAILGGEPLLHPNIEDILLELERRNQPYHLESNGILSRKLLDLAKEYRIPEIQISCDGSRETYQRIRGVNNYENIVQLIKELTSITRVRLNYVISPWNTRKDLLKVKELCDKFKIKLSVETYGEIEYYETREPKMKEIYKADDVQPFPRNLLLRLYNRWVNGDLFLPCYSIRWSCAIYPDGTVSLCTNKMVPLGNLKEQALRETWQSEKTVSLQNEYTKCNGCWAGCYRNPDITLAVAMGSFIPRFILKSAR